MDASSSAKTYATELRNYRRAADVTQAELADALGFATPAAVHRRETGAVRMDALEFSAAMQTVQSLARAKGIAATPADALAE